MPFESGLAQVGRRQTAGHGSRKDGESAPERVATASSDTKLRAMLVTGSLYPAGAERHTVTIANGLAARGHECHVVHVKDGSPSLADSIHSGAQGSVRSLGALRYFDRSALARFALHIRQVRPSIIVAANPYALMYSWLALRIARRSVPLVVTYHSTLIGTKERLQMLLYRLFFWTADCTVFVCGRQRRHWLRRGVFSRHNETIYNGVDTEWFHDCSTPGERATLRNALGFADSDYVIGISARLSPEKNHAELVDALALLRQRGIAARLLMIGDGECREAIEARARERKVAADVIIAGFQRDVRPYIAACDVMVLCSHTEAFSLAAIEAMSMGKPFVHSDVGGAAEMIRPEDDGYLYPAGNAAALADRLIRLADPAKRKSMGPRARARVETLFSEKSMLDRYEALLAQLCARAPAALR